MIWSKSQQADSQMDLDLHREIAHIGHHFAARLFSFPGVDVLALRQLGRRRLPRPPLGVEARIPEMLPRTWWSVDLGWSKCRVRPRGWVCISDIHWRWAWERVRGGTGVWCTAWIGMDWWAFRWKHLDLGWWHPVQLPKLGRWCDASAWHPGWELHGYNWFWWKMA